MIGSWESVGRRIARGDLGLLLTTIVCAAVPFLVAWYMPVEDGPAHLANAAILNGPGQGPLAEFFEVSAGNGTNILAHLGLAALLNVLPAALADKAMALFLLAGLPLAVRWSARALGPDSGWLAILCVPASSGFLLYMGLYNFLLGALLSILVLGLWLHRRGRFGLASGVLFVLGTLLVYASHPLPLLALLLGLAAATLDEVLRTREESGSWHRALRSLLLPIAAAAAVPIVLLFGFGATQATEVGYTRGFLMRGLTLPLDLGLALGWSEVPFVLLHVLAVVALGVVAVRSSARRFRAPGFLVAALLLTIAYFVGPDAVGEGYIILPRAAFYILVFGLLWLARLRLPPRAVASVGTAAALAIVGLAIVRIPAHVRVDRDVREFLSGSSMIQPGSTVVTLWGRESARGLSADGRRIDPLVERTSYLTASSAAIDLGFYPAYLGTFRVRFRPGEGISALFEVPFSRESLVVGDEVLDLSAYRDRHGRPIEFVRIWRGRDAPAGTWERPAPARLARRLEAEYDRIHVSEGGRLEMYRARVAVDGER